jgi:DNA-binding LacI/PurR family transcriptional regulator
MSLSEQVRQKLLSAILSGGYGPGQPLPTIRELARVFKVSANTVQAAIHELSRAGVVEARRGRGIVVKMASRPGRRSRRVGVPLPYGIRKLRRDGLWPHTPLLALRDRLAEAGLDIVLVPLVQMNELEIVEHIRRLGVAGIVLFEVYNDRLVMEIRELQLPTASMDYDTSHLGIPSVVFDNAWGGFAAARFLIERGHRHMMTVHVPKTHKVGQNPFLEPVDAWRVEGFRLALMNAGLPVRIEDLPLGDPDQWTGPGPMRTRLLELLGSAPAPTALFCRNDHIAQGVAAQLRALEYRVPEDISIVGFGDEGLQFAPGRRLTSVWVDSVGLGQTAAQCILRQIKQAGASPMRHVLPTHIAVHDSVADVHSPGVAAAVTPLVESTAT